MSGNVLTGDGISILRESDSGPPGSPRSPPLPASITHLNLAHNVLSNISWRKLFCFSHNSLQGQFKEECCRFRAAASRECNLRHLILFDNPLENLPPPGMLRVLEELDASSTKVGTVASCCGAPYYLKGFRVRISRRSPMRCAPQFEAALIAQESGRAPSGPV